MYSCHKMVCFLKNKPVKTFCTVYISPTSFLRRRFKWLKISSCTLPQIVWQTDKLSPLYIWQMTKKHTTTPISYVCKVRPRHVPRDEPSSSLMVNSPTSLWQSSFQTPSVTACLLHLRANGTINPQIFAHQLMIHHLNPLCTNVFVQMAVLSTSTH